MTTPQIVVSAAQRAAAGDLLGSSPFDWPDTPLGVVLQADGNLAWFASDGWCHAGCSTTNQRWGSITLTTGTLDNPLGTSPPHETVLPFDSYLPDKIDYAGGGPVYSVPSGEPGAGGLLLVYHAEQASDDSYYSTLGLAWSSNGGTSWKDLGIVITPTEPWSSTASWEIGDSTLVVVPPAAAGTPSYFYIYFLDPTSPQFPNPAGSSVARVDYTDLLTAVAEGTALPEFGKYYEGGFTQPGMGGKSTPVLLGSDGAPQVRWNYVTHQFFATLYGTGEIGYAESPDGLQWTSARVLLPASASGTISPNYATPIGEVGDPTQLGSRFYVYYTASDSTVLWTKNTVNRFEVNCAL